MKKKTLLVALAIILPFGLIALAIYYVFFRNKSAGSQPAVVGAGGGTTIPGGGGGSVLSNFFGGAGGGGGGGLASLGGAATSLNGLLNFAKNLVNTVADVGKAVYNGVASLFGDSSGTSLSGVNPTTPNLGNFVIPSLNTTPFLFGAGANGLPSLSPGFLAPFSSAANESNFVPNAPISLSSAGNPFTETNYSGLDFTNYGSSGYSDFSGNYSPASYSTPDLSNYVSSNLDTFNFNGDYSSP